MTEATAHDVDLAIGDRLHETIRDLYPICRSITGDGVRQTLRYVADRIPIRVHEVPTDTPVLDWTVPREWNIRGAWIKDPSGKTVVDFADHTLHVVNYSVPIHERMSLDALRPHLHSLPDQPKAIPYRTSYYVESWGFCLPHERLEALPEGEYEVCIDSTLEPGHLTYGELVLPGRSEDEVLFTTHVCHPSLCNDNLSGVAISIELARHLARTERHYTYRFLYMPGTIGSITWLERNRERIPRIAHGLSLVCLGDASPFTYKRTFGGAHRIDRVVPAVLEELGLPHEVIDFFPYGYDERQFNAPAFRRPVGSLMRGRHGEFPEYHTSGDDLDFVAPERLAESFRVLRRVCDVLDADRRYRSLAPEAEPQLGRRGIYKAMGGEPHPGEIQMAILWLLACADGDHGLLEIARRAETPLETLERAAAILLEHDLIESID